ncbi:hypothetical protein [Halocatena marina]|uniref:Uncharacterized protein n=1 Tax=Halocatena marina TaxID=2934937 RepID=A0ABD5YMH4_9EURY|nr:hypothetical protein [Halocatena marina]
MDDEQTEACGRCGMTSVVDAVGDEDRRCGFDSERIELDDKELRLASTPAVVAGRVKRRLDELATKFIHGR